MSLELDTFSLSKRKAKRVTLLDFPNEILSIIIEYLSIPDRRSIESTCRFLRQVTEPLLYQNLSFSLSSYFESSVFSARSLAFLYGQHVRSITIEPRASHWDRKHDSSIRTWRARDGSVLPLSAVQKPWRTSPPEGATVSRVWPRWFTDWFDREIGLLTGDNMPKLTNLVVHGKCWYSESYYTSLKPLFYQAARNAKLRKLELGGWGDSARDQLLYLLKGSDLNSLEVEDQAQFISWASNLLELTVNLPKGFTRYSYGYHGREGYERVVSDNMHELMPYLKSVEALTIKTNPMRPIGLRGADYTLLPQARADDAFHALRSLTLSGLQIGKGMQDLLSDSVPQLQTLVLDQCLAVSPERLWSPGTSWASTFESIAKYGKELITFRLRNLPMDFHLDHQFGNSIVRAQAKSIRDGRTENPGRMILPYIAPPLRSDEMSFPPIDHSATFSAYMEGVDHLEYKNLMLLMAKRSVSKAAKPFTASK